jgi:hypothetical protein
VRRHAKGSSAQSFDGSGQTGSRHFGRAFATRGASCDANGSGAPSRRAPHGVAGLLLFSILTLGALLGGAASSALAAEACPNEAIREQSNFNFTTGQAYSVGLPDCRAYEQVSPEYKNGAIITARGVGLDGNGLLMTTSGGFAGSESIEGNGGEYHARRTENGWVTESDNPPAERFPAAYQGFYDTQTFFSQDLNKSGWLLQDEDLAPAGTARMAYYVRQPGGAFVKASPALTGVPTGNIQVAASNDLSHILTVSPGDTLPTDGSTDTRTGGSDFFDAEAGNPPVFRQVAVDNSGATLNPSCGANPAARMSVISGDGSHIAFTTCSPSKLYSRVNGSQTFALDASQCNPSRPAGACNAASSSTYLGASQDGRRVFFSTTQQLVSADVDSTSDIYMCETAESLTPVMPVNSCPNLVPVTVTGTSTGANLVTGVGVSRDGTRTYFIAKGVLTGANPRGAVPVANGLNVYAWSPDPEHPGQHVTTFIGTVASVPNTSETDFGIGGGSGCPGQCADWLSGQSGRFLTFNSVVQLTADDTDSLRDVYLYDAVTQSLTRIWVSDPAHNGANRQSLATTPTMLYNEIGGAVNYQSAGSIGGRSTSEDGSYVFFSTVEALSPADTNGANDVYGWHNGKISLISDGFSPPASLGGTYFEATTPSGHEVFFDTRVPLVPQDTDTGLDVYVARIDGGFAAPVKTPTCDTVSGACQVASPAPAFVGPGTSNAKTGQSQPQVGPAFKILGVGANPGKRAKRTGKLNLSISAGLPSRLTATVSAPLGGKATQVGSASQDVQQAGKTTLRIRLSKEALATLAQTGELPVTVEVSSSRAKKKGHLSVTLKLGDSGGGSKQPKAGKSAGGRS